MTLHRGDVALADYPFSSGSGSSRRPVLIVQSDHYNALIHNVIVVQITSNTSRAGDDAHFLIDLSTPEGVQSGLLHDSVVSCINLATIRGDRINRKIGSLPDVAMSAIDDCLKVALDL